MPHVSSYPMPEPFRSDGHMYANHGILTLGALTGSNVPRAAFYREAQIDDCIMAYPRPNVNSTANPYSATHGKAFTRLLTG